MDSRRILIDCRACGGAGCTSCRSRGAAMVALKRPKALSMPKDRDAFEAARERCPCYQGISINAGTAQCTHADHRDGEHCSVEDCPVAKEGATNA